VPRRRSPSTIPTSVNATNATHAPGRFSTLLALFTHVLTNSGHTVFGCRDGSSVLAEGHCDDVSHA
jgi:hypothetical protein